MHDEEGVVSNDTNGETDSSEEKTAKYDSGKIGRRIDKQSGTVQNRKWSKRTGHFCIECSGTSPWGIVRTF